ncbi:MAG: iron-containing alcohol dehydrogenase, partial [Lentisphaeria bacterium]|nr:iron-containing alcohol dehydrogenase [Lentisphaeria bacterium]
DVLKAAPAPMAASGYADLAAKVAGGADWVIADELGIEPIRADVWELVQKDLRKWISDPADIGAIFLGLAATGYSMQMYRESRPASGAEHMISHLWEMENLEFNGVPVSHGFKVGIGTLASTALMEWLFVGHDADWARANARPSRTESERRAEVDSLLARGCYGAKTGEIAMGKFLTGKDLTARRELIFAHWDALVTRTAECLIPFDTLKAMFRAASCPVAPAEIGLDAAQFKHGVLAAQLIRNRYTILDVLDELGLLREAADAVTARMTAQP